MRGSLSVEAALIVVAGVIASSLFAAAIISQIYVFDSATRIASRSVQDRIETAIKPVAVAVNGSCLVVFLKNVGLRSISMSVLNSSDLYIGGSGSCSNYFAYGSWTAVDVDGDNVWSPGETLVITVYNSTDLGSPPFCVRLVLPNGAQGEALLYG